MKKLSLAYLPILMMKRSVLPGHFFWKRKMAPASTSSLLQMAAQAQIRIIFLILEKYVFRSGKQPERYSAQPLCIISAMKTESSTTS
jgi:hypothetical protein